MEQLVSRRRQVVIGVVGIVAGALCFVATIPGQAGAQSDPPGNNGTIKVDGGDFDDLPNNEPHVGCVFQVDWYGYDKGDLSSLVTFEVQPPTGNAVIFTDEVFIGEDDNSGGGSAAGLDASETYDLSAALLPFEPHPLQGWHVKLTVNAEGSQGADVKHKVFWVTGCESPPTTSTTGSTTTTTGSTTTTTTGSTTTTTPGGSTTTSLGGVSPTTVPPTGGLPVTGGSTTGPLAAVGAVLLAGGAALVGFARRFPTS